MPPPGGHTRFRRSPSEVVAAPIVMYQEDPQLRHQRLKLDVPAELLGANLAVSHDHQAKIAQFPEIANLLCL